MKAVIDISLAEILYEGSITEPRLNHPEGICVDQNGDIWCGGEAGEIYKLSKDEIWRFDLSTGEGELWYKSNLRFANGMALSADGQSLYVAETFAKRVSRIAIQQDGSTGQSEVLISELGGLPDGLALDGEGNIYISCYEPSRIYRYLSVTGELQLLIHDPEAHTLCHPTNMAFQGKHLYTSNLGRWHITYIPNDREGLSLPVRY